MPLSIASKPTAPSSSDLVRHATQQQEQQGRQSFEQIRPSTAREGSSPRTPQETSDHDMYNKDLPSRPANVPEDDLPALQTSEDAVNGDHLDPISQDDPHSFELVAAPDETAREEYSLEKTSQSLFSTDHLRVIFADPSFLIRFTTFLGTHKPRAIPILVHYLDCLKSIRAIHYANAISEGLDPVHGLDFTQEPIEATINPALEARAKASFDLLAREELPAYITHQYIQVVSASISARITGALSPHLREASEGLAEVFCLTDPSRQDNPIVFASEEFNRTTQYGMGYILGRNCRFLQGPMTNPSSVRRLRDSIAAGEQHQEVFLNYRRDGSPFMNLLMLAPLCDSRGVVRYNIGAQVDVSGLVKECSELESLRRLLELEARGESVPHHDKPSPEKNDEFRELSEMLNQNELSTIRRHGGRMHRGGGEEDTESVASQQQRRLRIKDPNTATTSSPMANGKLSGIYQHYLLVRPYPSLRIIFTSPSQRVPGVLQSPFMSRIGGSDRVREELTAAFADGRGVTAKVRWLTSKTDVEGRNRWIHCTPLLGVSGQIGVWMVVIVDDGRNRDMEGWERPRGGAGGVISREAPTVPNGSYTPERNGRSGGGYGGGNFSMPNPDGYANGQGGVRGVGEDDRVSFGGYSQTSFGDTNGEVRNSRMQELDV